MRTNKEYTIWDRVTPVAITSSTDATPVVVTATSHGFSTGDLVMIFGHTTNVAANGIFKVTRLTANTFSLQDRYTGADIAGTGGGAGSGGVVVVAPKIIYVGDHRNAILSYMTTGSATLTVKPVISIGKLLSDSNTHGNTPNFGATQAVGNPWTYVQLIDLADASTLNGSTGLAASGTDINKTLEVNTNGFQYFTLICTAWTQGVISAKIALYDNM